MLMLAHISLPLKFEFKIDILKYYLGTYITPIYFSNLKIQKIILKYYLGTYNVTYILHLDFIFLISKIYFEILPWHIYLLHPSILAWFPS